MPYKRRKKDSEAGMPVRKKSLISKSPPPSEEESTSQNKDNFVWKTLTSSGGETRKELISDTSLPCQTKSLALLKMIDSKTLFAENS